MDSRQTLTLRPLTGLLIVLVLLAGCAGGGGQAATTAKTTATTTVTNTTGTTDSSVNTTSTAKSTTLDSFEFPDGANATHLDASVLASTHEHALLSAHSFTSTQNTSEQFQQGSMDASTRTNVSAQAVLQTRHTSGSVEATSWSPASNATAYHRFSSGFATNYYVNDAGTSPNAALKSTSISTLVQSASWSAARRVVTVDGTPTVKYTADSITDAQRFQNVAYGSSYSNFSAAIYVSSRGVVKRAHYHVEMSGSGGGPTSKTETITVSNLGTADVAPPDWVTTAKASGVRMNASFQDGRSVLKLTVTNGKLASGSTIGVSGKTYLRGTLPQKVAAGDTIYLTGQNGRLAVSVNQKPSASGAALGQYVHVRIGSGDGGATRYENSYR